jgi:hypothetical protein
VLRQLSQHLYDQGELRIPEVGTIKIMHQPASLDQGDKMLHPPSYSIKYHREQEVNGSQTDGRRKSASYAEEMEVWSKQVQKHLQTDILVWPGVGKMEQVNNRISFYPESPVLPGLQAIPAQKVLRQNVAHTVLRGEIEGLSSDGHENRKEAKKISTVVIAGWIILFLAAGYITFYLYQHSFSPLSSGSRFKMVPKTIQPTHK